MYLQTGWKTKWIPIRLLYLIWIYSVFKKKDKSRFSRTMVKIRKSQRSLPYLAYTLGSTPSHSLISTGNLGLLFFRATYCVSIKSLKNEIKKKTQQRPNNILFLRPSLICFKWPSSVFFSDLNKKKRGIMTFIIFICQNQNINIFLLKMDQKKGASLVFYEKKVGSSVFGDIKNKNLPALFVFQKSGLRNTRLFFFSLNSFTLTPI